MDTRSLEALIKGGETPTVEFKVAPPAIGGFIVFGVVDKTWQIVGVKNTSDAIDTVLQAARLCKPMVRLDPTYPQIVELEGKELVIAHIPPNNGTLYQAGGVCWIRRGTFTVPLTVHEIEEFLYERGVLIWETQPVPRATLADLDTNLIETYLAQRPERSRLAGRLSNVEEILLNIGCATSAKDEAQQDIIRPTNAGMLLFERDPQQFMLQAEVVCVLYKDAMGKQRYADRRILHGTITQQIDQAEAFFRQYVPVAGYMEGFHRIDVPDYPLEALREAVVNAVVHRDYSLQGEAVRVFYYPDRIEIHNPGMLMPGLSLEELRQGKARSKPRNPVLATVLRDFPGGYMERVGSGIMFMIDQMRELGRPAPQFTEQGEFIVTFYRSFPSEDSEKDVSQIQVPSPAALSAKRKRRQKLALQYVHTHGFITYDRYQAMTGIPENVAIQDLEALRKQGSLRAIEQKHGGRYYRL